MKIRSIILILLETLLSLSVESALVSKYSRTPRMTKGSSKKVDFVMEKFTYGVCKHGGLDLFLYDITAGQCIQECRARTMCKSINMFLRVNWCRINFEENLALNKKCPHYHYSSKEDWIQKSEVGCESLNCSIKEKCMKKDGRSACVITECMNIPHLENGMVFGNDVKIGLTQAFMCNQGYEIKGDYVITCQADGTWSPAIPTCTEKKKAADKPSIDEESTSSSPKSTDVIATSSFTPPTTTATTIVETTAVATTTAAPTMTSLTTAKPTSQASTLEPTTVSSTSSTVMTQAQFTSAVVTSGGVSREAPSHTDENILNTDSRNEPYTSCPFLQVYDPGTDECIAYCPGVMGTTFQVHQNMSLSSEGYIFSIQMNVFNYTVCLDECLTDVGCAAIIIHSSVRNGANIYYCYLYHDKRSGTAVDELIKDGSELTIGGDFVYLRNCDSNPREPRKFNSPVECRIGEMYSYSTGSCHRQCNQTVNTFQKWTGFGITGDYDVGGNNLVFGRINVFDSHLCLAECSDRPSCVLLHVTTSSEYYDCDAYGLSPSYRSLFIDSEGETVYLRNCD